MIWEEKNNAKSAECAEKRRVGLKASATGKNEEVLDREGFGLGNGFGV